MFLVTTTAHFSEATIAALEERLTEKNGKPYLKCFVRNKDVMAKPEEIVRQLWLHTLIHRYKYPTPRIAVEYPVTMGRDASKRADIMIFDADRPTVPYIIIEVKQGKMKDGKEGELGKLERKVGRDLRFIERNLDFLKPGGRMAVVLPQGRFNNASDQRVREFIADRCRLLGVVGVHPNTFKPHTGTKTSVLFVQKWTEEEKHQREALKIYETRLLKSWYEKDPASGEWKAHRRQATEEELAEHNADPDARPVLHELILDFAKTEIIDAKELKKRGLKYPDPFNARIRQLTPYFRRERVRDDHGHRIVVHDLFSTPIHKDSGGGQTPEGIAEAFHEFAAREKLSFF